MTDNYLPLIFILGISAYASMVYQMIWGKYKPSFFSRGVWFLLGINSLAGVYLGEGTKGSVALATTLFLGNLAVFIVSYKKGSRDFGLAERISLVLLVLSVLIWLFIQDPFLLLIISLVAHFIGGIPTIWRTLKRADSEQAYHWYFFLAASILAVAGAEDRSIQAILFPAYFIFFEALVLILVNRKRLALLW